MLNTCHQLSPPVTYVYLYLRGNGTPYYVPDGELLQLTETSRYRQIGPGF